MDIDEYLEIANKLCWQELKAFCVGKKIKEKAALRVPNIETHGRTAYDKGMVSVKEQYATNSFYTRRSYGEGMPMTSDLMYDILHEQVHHIQYTIGWGENSQYAHAREGLAVVIPLGILVLNRRKSFAQMCCEQLLEAAIHSDLDTDFNLPFGLEFNEAHNGYACKLTYAAGFVKACRAYDAVQDFEPLLINPFTNNEKIENYLKRIGA
jgi:hypothetical protein